MAQEISTPIVFENENIVPGTETVSIKGAPIAALVRDVDYIIDYEKGELRFLTSGAAIEFGSLIEENGVDISYSHQIDYTNPDLFESQKEVYGEVATRTDDFRVELANGPIANVSRIFNQSTLEEYEVIAVHNNQVLFDGDSAPALASISLAKTVLSSRSIDPTVLRHINEYAITYPSNYDPTLNPLLAIDFLQSLTTSPYLLVLGGDEELPSEITIKVPLETVNIQLVTGARTLRLSNLLLSSTEDYSFALSNKLADTDYKELTITLAPTAIQKIRANNLYLNLSFTEIIEVKDEGKFSTTNNYVNEVLSFVDDKFTMLSMPRLVRIDDVGDVLVEPTLFVLDADTKTTYEEGVDYSVNIIQKKIEKISGGRITGDILVYYIEDRTLQATFTLVSDIVLVDYVWGNNALNWSNLRKEILVTQNHTLDQNVQFITLTDTPLNYEEILIYYADDFTKTPIITPISLNATTLRLHMSPTPKKANYVVEYVAISQPIKEGSPYYVTYKYGATRNVLRNRFAPLVGITETNTSREDLLSLPASTTEVKLTRIPNTVDSILIFAADDVQETPVATARSFNAITNILTTTAIPSAGQYVFRYITDGFDTSSLRAATTKLYETFKEGPTLDAFKNIISGFVETEPEITSGLTDRFVIGNTEHTIGNQLSPKKFDVAAPLPDGTDALRYVPARFNLGGVIESSREGFIKVPTASNLGLLEGTLEFLTGILFDVNDGRRHYFLDVKGDDPKKNRFSLYKSKFNRLNFDIWDNEGQLFRTSADVNKVYNTEILKLTAGDNTAQLTFDSVPAQIDLNNNETPDLYEALETQFVIMPETPTFPSDYLKASVKVLSYDAPTKTITFEPVEYSGRYVFSYIGGLVKFEETENFIAATWKLHTHDGLSPFYRLYINGIKIIDQTLQDLNVLSDTEEGTYDFSYYDEDKYQESEEDT